MENLVKSIRVFISSPGDVKDEREIAFNIATELQDDPSFARKIHIDIVSWNKSGGSTTIFSNMTPQEAINEGLPKPSESDIVVVILWSRIGTPLPSQYIKEDGSSFKSGTEWEYYDAVNAGRQFKKPLVILYRRMESLQLNPGDPDMNEKFKQYSFVNEFFDSFTNHDGSIHSGCNQYHTVNEFKDIFRRHLKEVVFKLFTAKEAQSPRSDLPPSTAVLHHNLPNRAYVSLLGRDSEIKRILLALGSRYPLISIEGLGGVGKSSLALEVAYSCLRHFGQTRLQTITFDYIVWISAKDKPDQEIWFDEVLNMIARVMDFFAITQKPLTEDKIFEINDLLQNRRTLILVDNFETIEDRSLENWLESVPEPSKVIVTSRRRQFRMSKPIDLEGLEDKDALDLIRRHTKTFEIEFLNRKSDNELLPLIKNTAGNPLAIVWSLGTLKGGTLTFDDLVKGLEVNYKNRNINKSIEYLFLKSWKSLSIDSQRVLSSVPLFVGVDSIRKDALCAASGLSNTDFDNAVGQLTEYKLLQVDFDEKGKIRYKVHPLTHTFARAKLNQRKNFENASRERWSKYFLEFIKENIIRDVPDQPYWNVLVSDKMQVIDGEWNSIREVIKWSDISNNDSLFLELNILLVHYMDSRFLNLQRMTYVRKSVQITKRLGMKEDEALLRLDALGWTLVEEGNLNKAYQEIVEGFNIAVKLDKNNQKRNDLIALGYAWQARVKIELGSSLEADALIKEALNLLNLCNEWIKSRVYMAAGDIALKNNKSQAALVFYQHQAESINLYGGEGNGYQVEPRLGLAYVGTGDLVKAEEHFNALRVNANIPIGKLYGDYGLALVAYKRNQKEEARRLATETKEAISRKTASNILLKLISDLHNEMEIKFNSAMGNLN